MNRRLGTGILMSLLLHGIVLSLQFGIPGWKPGRADGLTVRLAPPAPPVAAASPPLPPAPLLPPASTAVPPVHRRPAPPPQPVRRSVAPQRRGTYPTSSRQQLSQTVIAQDRRSDAPFIVPPAEAAHQPAKEEPGLDKQEEVRRQDVEEARRQAEEEARRRAEQLAQRMLQERRAIDLAEEQLQLARDEAGRVAQLQRTWGEALAARQAAEESERLALERSRAAQAAARQRAEDDARLLDLARQREQALLAAREEQERQAVVRRQQEAQATREAEQRALRLADAEQARRVAVQQAQLEERIRQELERQAEQQARERKDLLAKEAAAPLVAQAPLRSDTVAPVPQRAGAPAAPVPLGAGNVEQGDGGAGRGGAGRALAAGDLASRARALVRGIDLLDSVPAAVRPAEEARAPRRKVARGAERDVALRMYIDSFRQKIERNAALIGSQLGRERVRIDPLVSVVLRSDGSVEEVTILRSSGRAETDEAVRRIVRLNARYSAFPPNVAAHYDAIDIRRIWTLGERLSLLEELR